MKKNQPQMRPGQRMIVRDMLNRHLKARSSSTSTV